MLQPGDVLEGRFEIDRLATSGGAGVIYRGVDRTTGAPVAIKTMRSDATVDPRFRREAETLAALRHPGIVTYLGHGTFADELFLAMEWLEGEDLGARLKKSELTLDEAVGVARQIAAALGAAHDRSIVHRDVKPANVFLVDRRPDRAKLLDFGVARRTGLATLTASGILIGTPIYMAPEQARGASELDARVDVYGLGALLFRCLAGRTPFEGDTLDEVIARILTETAPRLRALASGIPPAIDELVASMLAKDPARRPADGNAVHAALLGIDRTSSPPPGPAFAAPATLGAGQPRSSSIAVRSVRDMSAARDQEYLCDGIADELINALTHIDGLRVAARSSSFRFKSQAADAREIGTRLGVDAVLEGGVRRAGDRLRVTVQLVDVATGYQRWAHRFDGILDDVFAIQDEIAGSVATKLRGLLTSREKDAIRRPGTSATAYAYYLRGRQLIHSVSVSSYESALEMFQRAIELDPKYAPAYAGAAQMHCRYYEWGGGGKDALAAADRATRKALELAPQLTESHLARAHVLKVTGQYDEAEREYREAIRINPGSFDAYHLYGRLAFQAGKIEESVALFRRAGELLLDDYQSPLLTSQSLRALGRTAEALEEGREGFRRLERQLALEPDDPRALSFGATALFFDGQRERALEWAERSETLAPDDPAILYNVACAYATMGEKDRALRCLEKTFGRGMGRRDWADRDPDLDPLRDDPRFQALLAKVP